MTIMRGAKKVGGSRDPPQGGDRPTGRDEGGWSDGLDLAEPQPTPRASLRWSTSSHQGNWLAALKPGKVGVSVIGSSSEPSGICWTSMCSLRTLVLSSREYSR